MAEELKHFTDDFTLKITPSPSDKITGTDHATGEPIKIDFSTFISNSGDEAANITDFEAEHVLKNAIGVIKVEYIQPQQQEEQYLISYVKWETNKWTWYFRLNFSPTTKSISLTIGTKVLMNGKYYILQAAGTYVEDTAIDSRTLASLIATNLIGVIKGTISDDIPVGNKGIYYLDGPGWCWGIGSDFNQPGDIGNVTISIPNGTKAFNTGISGIPGVEQYKTYILKADGVVSPEN